MKIKINEHLKNTRGEPIPGQDGKPHTLRDECINAVLAPFKEDTQKKKWDKYEIYKRLRDAGSECELTAEEIAIIKESLGKIAGPLIMGQCFEMLENTNKK